LQIGGEEGNYICLWQCKLNSKLPVHIIN
jgi:hypothetical protein